MKLEFDSVDEVRDFVKNHLKGARAGKNNDADEGTQAGGTGPVTGGAPAPLQPPGGQAGGFPGAAGFAPPGAGAGPAGGFPAPAAGPSPEVAALVQRINTRIDGAIASGQAADQVLAWFRGQCGPEAANATMDQIKQSALPKLSVPQLEGIAKLMNA